MCDNNNDNQNYAVSVDISIDNVIAIGFNNGTVKVYFPAYLNPVEQKKCTASLVENEDRTIINQVNQEPQPLNVQNTNLEQEQENVLGNLGKRSEQSKPKRKKKNRSKRKKLTHQEEQERDLESVFVENSCILI